MKKILLIVGAAAIATTTLAQSTNEALLFSRQNFGLSTSRSSAMGGAFTSLGADAAAMSINPAGLGMYNASEIVFSPGIQVGATRSDIGRDANGNDINSNSQSRTKATINNFAAIFSINGWSVGVGMNRLADFSGVDYIEGMYGEPSMAYIFRDQLQGVPTGSIGTDASGYGFNHHPLMWNAIMGYQTFLVDPVIARDPLNTNYTLQGVLNPGDMVGSTLYTRTNGAIDEFVFSGARNFNNILYVGMTFGVQNLTYNAHNTYREYADVQYNTGEMDMMELRQNTRIDGVGFNIKVGATLRPVPWFRVGVAYHSPTWLVVDEISSADMYNVFLESEPSDTFTPDLVQSYDMSTPSRLLAGMSFTIARRVIIAADYELTWYGNMSYDSPINTSGWRAPVGANDIDAMPNFSDYTSSGGEIDLNGMIRSSYRATNNYRIGVEAQPIDGLMLRAGFGYSESPYKNIDSFLTQGRTKLSDYGAWTQWSGGLGYRCERFSVDLSYVYGMTKELPSVFFDYVTTTPYENIAAGTEIIGESNIYRRRENHNMILSFAWRF